MEIRYKPFTGGRKMKRGVKIVSLSRGSFILTGVGAAGKSVTYKEFQQGKLKY
jgi:hypothetical protein